MKAIKYLMLLLAAVFMGCETNTIEMELPESELQDFILGVNPEAAQDSTPEFTYYDLNTGNVCMLNASRRRVDMIFNEQECLFSVEFGEDGLIKNLFMDSLTVCFSNYNGTKVDIAMVRGNESCIFTECEMGVDMESLRSVVMQQGGFTQTQTRGISDVAVSLDKFLRDNQENINDIFDYADNAIGLVSDRLTGNILDKLKIGERIDLLGDDLLGKALEIVNLPDDVKHYAENILVAKEAYDLAGELSIGDGRYKDVKKLRNFKRFNIVYNFFKLVMTNYTDYSDYCEELWLNFFEWRDRVHRENESLAEGALNSGYGDLKATLSWNFYADIDLHAIEPSGFHIYFGNKVSPNSGGFLDVDNIRGGPGSVENIYWEAPVDGTYTIYINYYGPYGGPSGSCRVALFYKGQSIGVHTVNMNYESGEQPIQTVNISNGAAEAGPVRANFVINYVDAPKK